MTVLSKSCVYKAIDSLSSIDQFQPGAKSRAGNSGDSHVSILPTHGDTFSILPKCQVGPIVESCFIGQLVRFFQPFLWQPAIYLKFTKNTPQIKLLMCGTYIFFNHYNYTLLHYHLFLGSVSFSGGLIVPC